MEKRSFKCRLSLVFVCVCPVFVAVSSAMSAEPAKSEAPVTVSLFYQLTKGGALHATGCSAKSSGRSGLTHSFVFPARCLGASGGKEPSWYLVLDGKGPKKSFAARLVSGWRGGEGDAVLEARLVGSGRLCQP